MRCQSTSIFVQSDISTHGKADLGGILTRQGTVVCTVEDGLAGGLFCEDWVQGIRLEAVEVEGENVAFGDVLDIHHTVGFVIGQVESLAILPCSIDFLK